MRHNGEGRKIDVVCAPSDRLSVNVRAMERASIGVEAKEAQYSAAPAAKVEKRGSGESMASGSQATFHSVPVDEAAPVKVLLGRLHKRCLVAFKAVAEACLTRIDSVALRHKLHFIEAQKTSLVPRYVSFQRHSNVACRCGAQRTVAVEAIGEDRGDHAHVASTQPYDSSEIAAIAEQVMQEEREYQERLPTSVYPRLERIFRLGDRLWSQRPDLQRAFPQIRTADYWYWLMWHGVEDSADLRAELYPLPDRFLMSRVAGESLAEAQEAHIANLEAARRCDREEMFALSKHTSNLESELDQRDSILADLKVHASNLESVRERDREVVSALSEHAGNLEAELERRDSVLSDLKAHISNLESTLERNRQEMSVLSEHASNLEFELNQRDSALAALKAHASNLEGDRQRDRAQVLELSLHTKNLDSDRERDRTQLIELSKHAENLEVERKREREATEQLSQHVENLEAERQQQRAQLAEQASRIGNLEQLLQGGSERQRDLELQLSRRDMEISGLNDHSSNRLREVERLTQRLNHLTSSFWVRLLLHLRLWRPLPEKRHPA